MQFTKVHQELAKPVYEAIPKIAEKAGKKCPKCKGSGLVRTKHYTTGSFNTEVTINCLACNGTGKRKWEWEPEVGEWCLFGFAPLELIVKVSKDNQQVTLFAHPFEIHKSKVTPLLHWETIRVILEELGYYLSLDDTLPLKAKRVDAELYKLIAVEGEDKLQRQGCRARGKDCQEAVQKAILALLEQLEEKQ